MATQAAPRGASALIAELASEARGGHFWSVVLRNALPAAGVFAFGWPALQAALLFVLESWLFVSLRCAIEISIDPKFAGKDVVAGGRPLFVAVLKHFIGAAILMAAILGLFAMFVLAGAFPSDDWDDFFETGWHDPSFVIAFALMTGSVLDDGMRFIRVFADRTQEQADADDGRVRVMFFRVAMLVVASFFLGWLAEYGLAGPAFIVVIALVSIWLEGTPGHASAVLGQSTDTRVRRRERRARRL